MQMAAIWRLILVGFLGIGLWLSPLASATVQSRTTTGEEELWGMGSEEELRGKADDEDDEGTDDEDDEEEEEEETDNQETSL
jgi:hypothetical protein